MRRMRSLLLVSVPAVLMAGCAAAPEPPPTEPFVVQGTACATQATSAACAHVRDLHVMAVAGNAVAQTALAERYLSGNDGGSNPEEALRWYRRSADQGNGTALYTLGYMAESGTGIPADGATAVTYYQAAAEAGVAEAQTNLGALLEEGRLVDRDMAKAIEWYQRAADRGSAPAQVNLARLLRAGHAVPADPATAASLLHAAADQGHPAGARLVAEDIAATDPVGARQLLMTATAGGDRQGRVALAEMMIEGRGGPVDLLTAKELLEPLAAESFAPAQFALGRLYRDAPERPAASRPVAQRTPATAPTPQKAIAIGGSGGWVKRADGSWSLRPAAQEHPATVQAVAMTTVEPPPAKDPGVYRDETRAAKLIEAAARSGLVPAALATGVLYYQGRGLPQDMTTAAAWYRVAAEAGSTVAQANLGVLYANGRGVPLDPTQAAAWFAKAAEAGDATAQLNLGIQYLQGAGVTMDHPRGAALIKKAAEQGHRLAQTNLSRLYERGVGVQRDPEQARYWQERAAATPEPADGDEGDAPGQTAQVSETN